MKNFILMLTSIVLISTSSALATEAKVEVKDNVKIIEPSEFQKVIDEYKNYVSKISPEIRDEVIAYRKEVARINKEKRMLYKKLSQESQDYLKKEQEYKKRLPLNKKALINVEAPGEKTEAR